MSTDTNVNEAGPSAAALKRLASVRDPEAWQVIVERHGAAILQATQRITRDESLAQDACQETLLQIRDDAGQFHPRAADSEASARAWIMRIACNTALKMLQSRRRSARHENVSGSLSVRHSPPPAELVEVVQQELMSLPEKLRQPIMLHYYGGLDYETVSSTLGCSTAAAKMRASRGLERLRQRLALLGLILTLPGICEAFGSEAAHPVAEATMSQNLVQWRELINSSRQPQFHYTAHKGVSTMAKMSAGVAASVLLFTSIMALGSTPGVESLQPARVEAGDSRSSPAVEPAVIDVEKALNKPVSLVFNATYEHVLSALAAQTGVEIDGRELFHDLNYHSKKCIVMQAYRDVPLRLVLDHFCSFWMFKQAQWRVAENKVLVSATKNKIEYPTAESIKNRPALHPGIMRYGNGQIDKEFESLPLFQGFGPYVPPASVQGKPARAGMRIGFNSQPFETWATRAANRVGDYVEGFWYTKKMRREIVALNDDFIFVNFRMEGEEETIQIFERKDYAIARSGPQWKSVNKGRIKLMDRDVSYELFLAGVPANMKQPNGQWTGLKPKATLKAVSTEVPLDGVLLDTLCAGIVDNQKIEGNDGYRVVRWGNSMAKQKSYTPEN